MVESNNSINNTIGADISGVTNTLTITNPSNTANSAARMILSVGGATSSDPSINWKVNGVQDWAMGIDNGDSDSLKISENAILGTNDTWIMNTEGIRTLPLQSAFGASLSTPQNNVTGDTTSFKIICDTEDFDINNDYDTGTGLFTAPIDGIYIFSYSCKWTIPTTAITAHFLGSPKNGGVGPELCAFGPSIRDASNEAGFSTSFIFKLIAADTVQFNIKCDNGPKTVSVLEANFQGTLLH